MTREQQRIAMGESPSSLGGFWFWLRYWSPLATWWGRWRARP